MYEFACLSLWVLRIEKAVAVPAESPSTSLIWTLALPNRYFFLDSYPQPETGKWIKREHNSYK